LDAEDLTHHDYTWEIIGGPIDGLPPVLIPSPPPSTLCTLQLEERGGYLIRLTVDAGLPTEDVSILYAGIPLLQSGLPLPAEYETNFDNSVSPYDGSQGWWYKLERWFKWADATIGSGGLGDLPITRTIYVDGARVDPYIETGSFGHPFKTIAAGIAFAASLPPAEYCLHIRPFKYDEPDLVLFGNIHIDAEMGSELAPSTDSDGLVVVPGPIAPLAGVTFIRGLNIAGRGVGKWGLKIQMPLPMLPFTAFVAHIDACIGTYADADLMFVETGGLYLTDAGGYYGDSTNKIGLRVAPPVPAPFFQSVALVGMWNISANEHAFDVGIGGAILAANTKVDVNVSPASGEMLHIDGGLTPILGALFMGKGLRLGGDWAGLVEQHGYAIVQIDTSDGNNPAMLSSYTDDIFRIHGGYLFLTGGSYATPSGRGLALLADEADVYCWAKNVDISSDEGGISTGYLIETSNLPGPPGVGTTVTLESRDCRYQTRNMVPGRKYTHLAHTQGGVYIDGGIVEGGSGGGPPFATILDCLSGLTWITGGVDINANQQDDVAIHVAPGAALLHGHANVRVGEVVVDPGGFDYPLNSSFGTLQIGKYDSIVKVASWPSLGDVTWEPDYPHGSFVVETGDPAEPRVYINYGTDLARDWRLFGGGNPTVRIQRSYLGTGSLIPLVGSTRAIPVELPWATNDYLDTPPFTVLAPRIVQVSEEGDYKLSYHVTWKNEALLAFGTSVSVMWLMSTDNWMTSTEIVPTVSYDSTPNIVNCYGSNDLAPYEIHLTAGTQLKVVAYLSGMPGTVFIDAFDSGGGTAYENSSWARIERGGGGGGGGPVPLDWTVEFVTAPLRVLSAADHKKTFIALVDSPNTVTIRLPSTPFIGQEIRVVHGGQLLGPSAGHLTIAPAAPGDKGIGVSDSDYAQLDAEGGGSVVHLLCIDSGVGYWSSRFWGCGDGSGEWWDATHLGSYPLPPPYNSNQFYLNFQSPFNISAGGPGSVQLNERTCDAYGVFSLAFGYIAQTLMEYSEAFGCNVQANWVGEAVRSGGGFAEFGSAQSSRINLYCHTDPYTPFTDLTPTGIGGFPLTVLPNKVYACEVLLVAAMDMHIPGDTLCAAWKLEFLVHGGSPGSNAMLVGSLNKLLFSRDPNPIIDPWDVNVTVGGPGPLATDIKITVTQGVSPRTVRWDAELNMAQVIVRDEPT
jgi:hypothetical protein